jgi:guanine deaminase
VQKIILAHVINPQSDKKSQYFPIGAILLKAVSKSGKKTYKVEAIGEKHQILKRAKREVEIIDYSQQVIIPSFFDMHFHWVQDDVREMPKDNLLNWLDKYTFPAEAKFKNKNYAKRKAKVFFKRLASSGTLGGACFSSVHGHTVEYAMDEAVGDLVIGNVLMTMNSPKSLCQTPKEAISLVKKLSAKYKDRYCLTPRFAIATDPKTMKETSDLVKKYKCFKQSHLCETQNEIDFVTSMYREMKGFENLKSYTDIYKKVGMLGPRSIMGHGIHLTEDEITILAKTKTAIAHCPTSNAPKKQLGLGSGLFDFKKVEKAGIPWALGSDIGGGPFLSMFDVMRSFVAQNEKAKVTGATFTKALHRATLAGAQLLKLSKTKGNLDPNKEANFIVIKKINLKDCHTAEAVLRKIITSAKNKRSSYDHFADKVFYQGKLIHSNDV